MEPEDITGLPAFAHRVIKGMRQATKQKWMECAATFFARAIINKYVSIACGEAGFSEGWSSIAIKQLGYWLKRSVA